MTEIEKTKEDYNIDFERIIELISKYEQVKKSGEIKRYNEESTKKDFILPLFEALGWNVYNRGKKNDSISAEETISKKRVDYGFRINGIPKFFLEAKSLKEENIQTNSKYVTQAIDYAWMKSCSWAILTNFETIAVYNADWKESNYGNNLFFVLHPNDFLLSDSRFVYLSKGAFEDNELDKTASKYGKKQVKNPINKQLLQDMIYFREILSKDIVRNNQDKHLSQDDIDESVQRILDRLIFIRNAEDRGLEEDQLQSDVRQWYAKGKGHLIKEISRIYKDYDDNYNSKLFAHHLCDDLYIENEALQEVIEGLNQSKDNSYRYDFSIIESDVLGNIYEQYLGNILKSTPKRAKLEESKTHRKEQGIYYTPSYIVDYIVKNTVGEYIKNHTPEEIRKVRIVDPACGSGSFLIRAYKELENYWIKNSDFAQLTLDSEEFYSKKVEILKNNIFGVDLDPKAVEIAQLNLLLQISERKHRLPLLQNNIKVGNSLIDDPSVSDKAFKWEEEFPEIMKEGGFDIVIGNPPYIKEYTNRGIFEPIKFTRLKKYYKGKMDIWYLFASLSIDLLKKGGYHSFIAQNNWITSFGASLLRDKVLKETRIISFVDFRDYKVFEGAEIQTMIYVIKKESMDQPYPMQYYKIITRSLPVDKIIEFLNNPKLKNNYAEHMIVNFDPKAYFEREISFINNSTGIIISKIMANSNYHLADNEISTGIDVHQDFVNKSHLQFIKNESIKVGDGIFVISENELQELNLIQNEKELIEPYYTSNELTKYYGDKNNKFYIIYTKSDISKNISNFPNVKKHLDKFRDIITTDFSPYGLHRARDQKFFEGEHILSLRKTTEPCFTYVDFPCYVSQTYFVIKPQNANMRLLTGILNSKVIHYWLRNKGKQQGSLLQIDKAQLTTLPIALPNNSLGQESLSNSIITSVELIINFIKKRNTSTSQGDRGLLIDKIRKEIEKLDVSVYKLYDLDDRDIKQIEAFLSNEIDKNV